MNVVLIFLTLILLSGCGKGAGKSGGAPQDGFATPVVAITVVPQTITHKMSVVGSLQANEWVDVKSQIEGVIKEIRFNEGQRVKRNDVLIVLDAAKLQATVDEYKANLGMAQTTFKRMKALVEGGAVSKQEYDQAKSEVAAKKAQADLIGAQLKDTLITASFDGIMGERKVSVGQVITKEMSLTALIDENPMKVEVHVPERYLSRLESGQAIELTVAAYPNEIFTGQVYFINPQIESTTRTVLVKAKVPNPEGALHSGMFAKVDLVVDQKSEALVIPETALIPKGEDTFVFTVGKDNKAAMVPVKTGIRLEGLVEITSGLHADDVVVTEGYQKIGPGSLVNVSAPEAQPTPEIPPATDEYI